MELAEYVEQCKVDSIAWFGEDNAKALTVHALGLAGEAGEVVNIVRQLLNGQVKWDQDTWSQLAVEVIDTLTYVFTIANILQVDLDQTFWNKREFNVERFGESPIVVDRLRPDVSGEVGDGSPPVRPRSFSSERHDRVHIGGVGGSSELREDEVHQATPDDGGT